MESILYSNPYSEVIPFIESSNDLGDKQWSYFNLYFLREIKDIYQLLCRFGGKHTISEIYSLCVDAGIVSENGKQWNCRNILEITNALKKLDLVDEQLNVKDNALFESGFNADLSQNDKHVFAKLFFTYFRFQEFHKLYCEKEITIDNLKIGSSAVLAFKENDRFYNRYISNEKLYFVDASHSEISRFWDVYIKWGTELELMEKQNVKSFGVDFPAKYSDLVISYFIHPIDDSFSILEYMDDRFGTTSVSIKDLIWALICDYRFSLESIKRKLIVECEERPEQYRMQSTSAIFVKKQESKILPIYNNMYMSHIIKL